MREESGQLQRSSGVKRQLEEEEEGEGEGEMEVVGGEGEVGGASGTKRVKEEGARGGGGGGTKPDLNFPLPGETGLPCLLKVSTVTGTRIHYCR